MAKKRNLILAILTRTLVSIVVVAAGIAVLAMFIIARPQNEPADLRDSAPPVQVMRPAVVDVHRQFEGFGTAEAARAVDVPAEVAAIVIEVPDGVIEGRHVEKGEVLARLDASDYDEQFDRVTRLIEQFNAQLEHLDVDTRSASDRLALADDEVAIAERDLERIQTLFDRGDAKALELDQAEQRVSTARRQQASIKWEVDRIPTRRLEIEAQRAAAEADRRLAQRNIDRTTITAPMSGEIEMVDVEVGEQVAPGQRVVRLVEVQKIEVPVRLPSSARQFVRVGDEATLRSTGAAESTWSGRVLRVGPADDEATRTFPAYVEVLQRRDARPLLTPGSYVAASIVAEETDRRMVIPRRAVAGDRVFAIDGERIVSKPVVVDYFVRGSLPVIGLGEEDYWAVLARPLDDGLLVALNGAADLRTGELVRPVVMNAADDALARDGAEEEHSSD